MVKKRRKLRGTVERIIKATPLDSTERAQINIKEADDLYREIRVENVLQDDGGKKVRLEKGEEVDVTLEAETDSKKKSD
jgi:hypothetical protein